MKRFRGFQSEGMHLTPHLIWEVGDKVIVPKWMAISDRYNRGFIKTIDGGDIYVQLNYKDIICHVYDYELKTLKGEPFREETNITKKKSTRTSSVT